MHSIIDSEPASSRPPDHTKDWDWGMLNDRRSTLKIFNVGSETDR